MKLAKPDFSFERQLLRQKHRFIIGVDEVGRGALAGPLVVGGVIFPPKMIKRKTRLGCLVGERNIWIDDSKRLSPDRRGMLAPFIKQKALFWAVARVEVSEINCLGIVKATYRGVRRVSDSLLKQLSSKECFVLSDFFEVPHLRGIGQERQRGIKKGDQLSVSIAAASILAKVYRDGLMEELGKKKTYQVYGWQRNKGYGTKLHQEAIIKRGATKYHRKAFIGATVSVKVR